jgi:hypothetical protein
MTYELRHTNFHACHDSRSGDCPYSASEDVISRHRTLSGCVRARRRYMRGVTCQCGCAVIVASDGRDLSSELYALEVR